MSSKSVSILSLVIVLLAALAFGLAAVSASPAAEMRNPGITISPTATYVYVNPGFAIPVNSGPVQYNGAVINPTHIHNP